MAPRFGGGRKSTKVTHKKSTGKKKKKDIAFDPYYRQSDAATNEDEAMAAAARIRRPGRANWASQDKDRKRKRERREEEFRLMKMPKWKRMMLGKEKDGGGSMQPSAASYNSAEEPSDDDDGDGAELLQDTEGVSSGASSYQSLLATLQAAGDKDNFDDEFQGEEEDSDEDGNADEEDGGEEGLDEEGDLEEEANGDEDEGGRVPGQIEDETLDAVSDDDSVTSDNEAAESMLDPFRSKYKHEAVAESVLATMSDEVRKLRLKKKPDWTLSKQVLEHELVLRPHAAAAAVHAESLPSLDATVELQDHPVVGQFYSAEDGVGNVELVAHSLENLSHGGAEEDATYPAMQHIGTNLPGRKANVESLDAENMTKYLFVGNGLAKQWETLCKNDADKESHALAPQENHQNTQTFTPLQAKILPQMLGYGDIMFTAHAAWNDLDLCRMCGLHALNHVLKGRRDIKKHDAKLSAARKVENEARRKQKEEEYVPSFLPSFPPSFLHLPLFLSSFLPSFIFLKFFFPSVLPSLISFLPSFRQVPCQCRGGERWQEEKTHPHFQRISGG
jgi:hypothetical protein